MKDHEQTIEHIVQRMLADRAVDAPADAIKFAKNLYRTRSIEQPASLMQRIIAVMTADMAPNMPAFGERSGAAGQARQMLFEAGANAVDLRITATKQVFDIRGQILGDGFENADLELSNAGTRSTARTDKMSTFSLASIPTGEYSLTIRRHAAEIVIEQITLR